MGGAVGLINSHDSNGKLECMSQSLDPDQFFQAEGVLLDVRSPAEYTQGHIPGAKSFPLFTDEERAKVGICYKQEGRDRAVELGFAIVGPKCADLIAQAKTNAPDRNLRLYCWRGGMRSGAVAWVLEMAGFNVSLLSGGYKAFRRWGRSQFQIPRKVILLGGMTGTGKTEILKALADLKEQILDLEALANHRGSSYGALGLPPQPTNEQFWNLIAIELAKFSLYKPLWIEAESKRIGLCRVPEEIFDKMRQAPVIQISRSRTERLALLVQSYGNANSEELVSATERIRKHLGGLKTQEAVDFIQQGKLTEASDLILEYYDKAYSYDLKRRESEIYTVNLTGLSATEGAVVVREAAQQILTPTSIQNSC